jgi:general stress protein 26
VDETNQELDELQALLDASFARSSKHLLSIMTPQRRLDARRLVGELTGIAVLNVATVTAGGEPRISAVDGHFLHGRWHFTTAADSPKVRQLRARPSISAAYTPRDGFGVFVHGTAELLQPGSAPYEQLDAHCQRLYGQSPSEWADDFGAIAFFRIKPHWMVAFAMTEEEMAPLEADKAARTQA